MGSGLPGSVRSPNRTTERGSVGSPQNAPGPDPQGVLFLRLGDAVIPNKALLRPDEVASILRVSRSTVYRWVEEGRLPALKPGNCGVVRICRNDLLRFLDASY